MPEPFVVAFLGGSITLGSGASDPKRASYRALVTEYLEDRLPDRRLVAVNAAIGGTGSDFGLFRLQRDVLRASPDLVFVEFAVNDDGMAQAWRRRSFESLLRALLQYDPPLVVVVLTTRADADPAAVQDHRAIAEHYGVAVIDAGAVLREQAAPLEAFLPDGVHPNDAGHRVYADAIVAGLPRPFCSGAACHAPGDPGAWQAAPLRTMPLRRGLIEAARMVTADESPQALGAPVVNLPSPSFPRAWSLSPCAEPVSVEIDGGIVGLAWWVSSDAGSVRWRLDEGEWREAVCWDEYARHFDRLHHVVLADGPRARSLQIAALETPVPGSQGPAVRIAAVFFGQQGP